MLRKKNPKSFESGLKALDDNGDASCETPSDDGAERKKGYDGYSSQKVFTLSFGGLLVLSLFYAPLIWQARKYMYQKHVVPLPDSAPLDKFSQERAMHHIWSLAGDISGRQESTSGLEKAFTYLHSQLNILKGKSSSDIKIEIDDSLVDGSFNMMFLGHAISNTYMNHRNLAVRVSARDAHEGEASVLINGHLDSPLGSAGAADCASCVATMLEVLRYIVDTNWVPPSPLVFLFNGAEEVYMLGAHGFMTTNKWKDSLGAVINIEASGGSGPDLVCQSGPGTWPARVYAENAVHPMANTVAQDVMPLIPGDTDYRVFSSDFGDIPGLDIIFVLDGYIYHTGYDTADRVSHESLQARGENLIALLEGFTTAPELKNSSIRASHPNPVERRPIFFDFYGMWMISYSQKVAFALHLLPLALVFLVPGISTLSEGAPATIGARVRSILLEALLQAIGYGLSILFPVLLAIIHLTVSKAAMTWFAHPWISYFMFTPVSIVGFLVPRAIWYRGRKFQTEQEEMEADWTAHWGGVALNAAAAAIYISLGISSGYMSFYWAFFMLPALSILRFFQRRFGKDSLLALAGYILPGLLPAAYMCYYSGITIQLITEKMGMSGTFPPSVSFYVADVILAVVFGIFVGVTVGPLLAVISKWIGRPPAIRFLFYVSISATMISSLLFPYSYNAPKRVILTHAFRTNGPNEVLESTYSFATIDPNPMEFVWKHSPEAVRMLHINPQEKGLHNPNPNVFLALYPISTLLTLSPELHIDTKGSLSDLPTPMPYLRIVEQDPEQELQDSMRRRVHLEVHMGALDQVWSTVLNITGPLASWSLVGQELPGAERVGEGPPSYICRLSGKPSGGVWHFWVESESSEKLRIELAVLDQAVNKEMIKLAGTFPAWVALVSGSTYISTYLV